MTFNFKYISFDIKYLVSVYSSFPVFDDNTSVIQFPPNLESVVQDPTIRSETRLHLQNPSLYDPLVEIQYDDVFLMRVHNQLYVSGTNLIKIEISSDPNSRLPINLTLFIGDRVIHNHIQEIKFTIDTYDVGLKCYQFSREDCKYKMFCYFYVNDSIVKKRKIKWNLEGNNRRMVIHSGMDSNTIVARSLMNESMGKYIKAFLLCMMVLNKRIMKTKIPKVIIIYIMKQVLREDIDYTLTYGEELRIGKMINMKRKMIRRREKQKNKIKKENN